MSDPLTFMAVHAHPDDEASSTGGVLRLLADQGVRTVLVTCTNGEFGDAPGGVKPHTDDHDADEVAVIRALELDAAVEALRVTRLVRLGYRDSGMQGWPQNDDPRSFWATSVDEAASRLADVMREERPDVVATYNRFGFYGHPDHVQAHRITMAAVALLDYEPTVYFNAIPDSVMAMYRERWEQEEREQIEADREKGILREPEDDRPTVDGEEFEMGTPDEQIDVVVDIHAVADAKFDALAAHHSQIADSFWMKMGREQFKEVMRLEWFVRATNPLHLDGQSGDILAGYR